MLSIFDRFMEPDEGYMHRCLQMAMLGSGSVAPNPMVGAVLVHQGKIIGEGYHQQFGQPHAEVNCINSVTPENLSLLPQSTLYVSLEPCAHFGKTPPCADLIIEKKIRHVVIGSRDPFSLVNGKGIEKLVAAGVQVKLNVLEEECLRLNKRFFTYHQEHRPYIILKWAQTVNNKIGSGGDTRLHISGEYSNRLVHLWRSEEMAILIGTNTAALDNPALTTRLWPGKSPIRLIIDKHLQLSQALKIFEGTHPTIIFNFHRHDNPVDNNSTPGRSNMGVTYYQVAEDRELVPQVLHALYQMGIQSVLVEGGAYLLQSFIDAGRWDEARVITNNKLAISNGLSAPMLTGAALVKTKTIYSESITFYTREKAT